MRPRGRGRVFTWASSSSRTSLGGSRAPSLSWAQAPQLCALPRGNSGIPSRVVGIPSPIASGDAARPCRCPAAGGRSFALEERARAGQNGRTKVADNLPWHTSCAQQKRRSYAIRPNTYQRKAPGSSREPGASLPFGNFVAELSAPAPPTSLLLLATVTRAAITGVPRELERITPSTSLEARTSGRTSTRLHRRSSRGARAGERTRWTDPPEPTRPRPTLRPTHPLTRAARETIGAVQTAPTRPAAVAVHLPGPESSLESMELRNDGTRGRAGSVPHDGATMLLRALTA